MITRAEVCIGAVSEDACDYHVVLLRAELLEAADVFLVTDLQEREAELGQRHVADAVVVAVCRFRGNGVWSLGCIGALYVMGFTWIKIRLLKLGGEMESLQILYQVVWRGLVAIAEEGDVPKLPILGKPWSQVVLEYGGGEFMSENEALELGENGDFAIQG